MHIIKNNCTNRLHFHANFNLETCGQGYTAEPLILPEGDVISLDGIAEYTNIFILS